MIAAFVNIWDKRVGAIAWQEETGYAVFEYNPEFKKLGWELSPLKMPLNENSGIFAFPENKRKLDADLDPFKGLPGLLADALPDRYGSELLKLWLARQGRAENSMNPIEILCFIGKRGLGALEFEPTITKEETQSFSLEIESLITIAQKIMHQKEKFSTNLAEGEEKALREILKIGTSAGGARPKAVIAYNEQTGEVRSGQSTAPKGFEHWLLKLDGVSDIQLGDSKGYGRVEMAYYLMALDCGIDMMPCRLLEENGRAHFMTKRFDREGNIKHHIQTFCAMKHFDFNLVNSYSYEQLFQTMRELRLPYPDAEQMFRRMVFNVLAKNCDDHTKNFSFRLKKGGRWELAPAYDICHAYKPHHKWVSQHALSVNGKRDGITKIDLLAVAKSMNIKKASHIIQEIYAIIQNWEKYAKEVAVAKGLTQEIKTTLIKWA